MAAGTCTVDDGSKTTAARADDAMPSRITSSSTMLARRAPEDAKRRLRCIGPPRREDSGQHRPAENQRRQGCYVSLLKLVNERTAHTRAAQGRARVSGGRGRGDDSP